MAIQTEDSAQADALVRRAHERAYRYPASFEGFRAELLWRTESASGHGSVVARTGPEVDVEVDGGEQDLAWVTRELRSIVGHRQASDYDRGDGAHEKRLAVVRSCARASSSSSATLSSRRTASEAARSRPSPGRWAGSGSRSSSTSVRSSPAAATLPVAFTVFFWDSETGALTATEAYRDVVVEVDRIFLPASRRVVRGDSSGLSVRELELSEHARPRRCGGTVTRVRGAWLLAVLVAFAAAGGRRDGAARPRRRSSRPRRRPFSRRG